MKSRFDRVGKYLELNGESSMDPTNE